MNKITKIRPKTEIKHSNGIDGWDAYDYIAYYCPTCGREIRMWHFDAACDKCGTFYDWGDKEPKIKTIKVIEWD